MADDLLDDCLITGHTGFLGSRILSCIEAKFEGVKNHHQRLELSAPHEVESAILDRAPRLIIHTAALSSLADCESDPARADVVNHEATRSIARAAARCGARMVYLSTDQVFDGSQDRYDEDSPASPLHVYGLSKRRGEIAAQAELEDVVILRLPLIFGRSATGRRSASEMILRAAEEGRTLELFKDEWRCPASAGWVAEAVLALALSTERGIRHLPGPRVTNRFEFGKICCEVFGLDADLIRGSHLKDVEGGPPRPPKLVLESRFSTTPILAPHPDLRSSLRSEHPDNYPSSS